MYACGNDKSELNSTPLNKVLNMLTLKVHSIIKVRLKTLNYRKGSSFSLLKVDFMKYFSTIALK